MIGGAPGGIGHAQALGLAEYGADVIMASSSLDDSEKVADEIRGMGRQFLAIEVNLSLTDETENNRKLMELDKGDLTG